MHQNGNTDVLASGLAQFPDVVVLVQVRICNGFDFGFFPVNGTTKHFLFVDCNNVKFVLWLRLLIRVNKTQMNISI